MIVAHSARNWRRQEIANRRYSKTLATSNANAACYPDHAAVTASSTIASLSVNGLSVRVTGAPNAAGLADVVISSSHAGVTCTNAPLLLL
jgi:hypothetical protein